MPRPEALCPATAKAAATPQGKLATHLSSGGKDGRKRMAEFACVYEAAPVPRTPNAMPAGAQSLLYASAS